MTRAHGCTTALFVVCAASAAREPALASRPADTRPSGPAADRRAADAVAARAPSEHQLIPRRTLFGNPRRITPRISPDGDHVAFLAPDDGVMNIWIAPADRPDAARALTRERGRGLQLFRWAYDGDHLLYAQDRGGDESWKIYAVEIESGRVRDLTPFDIIPGPDGRPLRRPDGDQPQRPAAQFRHVSPRQPDEILIAINNRNPQYRDVYRVNIDTGAYRLVFQNDRFDDVIADDDYRPRVASEPQTDGSVRLFTLDEHGRATPLTDVPFEDSLTTYLLGLNGDGSAAYLIDSRGRNTAALTALDLATGRVRVLAEDPRADADIALIHPRTRQVQAVSFVHERTEWKFLDAALRSDFQLLPELCGCDGDLGPASRSLDDRRWIVACDRDAGPAQYFLYERGAAAPRTTRLFSVRPELERLTMATMRPVTIRSRDGLDLVSYLSLPPGSDPRRIGRPAAPLPMVLLVHGGPWERDFWGFRDEVQWLANRGYAVLQVNFRGSSGFGKAFLNAADREWGRRMQDDLLDAVEWAVQHGIADRRRIGIFGGSYGGYAVLAALTFSPETFACGVDLFGIANLQTFMDSLPPHWAPFIQQTKRRVGDFDTAEGRSALAERSPVNYADRIRSPLLIAQGANDPRVRPSESEQMVKAMQQRGVPVTYLTFSDEGHGFVRPENRIAFFAAAEAFLAEHLGGRYEPIGADLRGSTLKARAGAEQVAGLGEAVERGE